jgi:hypothetical protein
MSTSLTSGDEWGVPMENSRKGCITYTRYCYNAGNHADPMCWRRRLDSGEVASVNPRYCHLQ